MLGVKAYDCVTDQNLLHIVANIVFLSYVSAVLLVSLLWLPLLYFRPKYNDKVTWVTFFAMLHLKTDLTAKMTRKVSVGHLCFRFDA